MTTPPLPLTLPDGAPLPPRPTETWRQHTGTTLAKHHPEAHAQALDLIRHGESITEVARLIGPELGKTDPGSQDGLRKIIRGWIIDARIDLTDIARLKAAIVRDEALEAAANLLPQAKVRDLGPIAMTLTQANQVERNLGGLPTEIKLTTKLTLADLEALRQPPPPRDITPIIDLENDKIHPTASL
jgi:hypothetical protein